jgi:hypothetical protein
MESCLQVDKPVQSVSAYEKLCNDVYPGSFNADKREVNFKALDSKHLQVLGLVGSNDAVWQFLIEKGTTLFPTSYKGVPCLINGIRNNVHGRYHTRDDD